MDTNFRVRPAVRSKALVRDKNGAAAVEYVLIAAIIGAAIVGGAGTLGTSISTEMTTIGTAITSYTF